MLIASGKLDDLGLVCHVTGNPVFYWGLLLIRSLTNNTA